MLSFPSIGLGLVTFAALAKANLNLPSKIYGVNLGSWLLIEPWMLPQEWQDMGGQICNDCSACISSEYAFVQAYPQTADQLFNQHWNTWFTAADVAQLKAYGINTVRVPLGYWIVEDLVDRSTEFYPRGGLVQLKRGLTQLYNAGITVILDHHALPGVQSAGQEFTGRCTNDVEFYTDYNYNRALIWTIVMTALSCTDSAFKGVAAIEAVNEPTMDGNQTPDYDKFQTHFVKVLRATELATLGLPFHGMTVQNQGLTGKNLSSSLRILAQTSTFRYVSQPLMDAIPIINHLGIGGSTLLKTLRAQTTNRALYTNFMDDSWQYNSHPNPSAIADGPQIYDTHLYYSFGGIAAANATPYLQSICNNNHLSSMTTVGNTPLFWGEWSLATNFNATDAFLKQWADAQKFIYSQSRGWIFWNFKIEDSLAAGNLSRQWSYTEGVKRGYLTVNPAQYNDPHVCNAYKS